MRLGLHVELPREQVTQADFFQHLAQGRFSKQQFHIEWHGLGKPYSFFETTLPWRINPLRLFMRPQTPQAKQAEVRNLTSAIVTAKETIVSNYNVDQVILNLQRLCNRILRNTTPDDKKVIAECCATAIRTLRQARAKFLQAEEKKWIAAVEQSPKVWEAFFHGEALLKRKLLTPGVKLVVAKRIESWVKDSKPLLRFMKADTRAMIQTLTKLRGRVTSRVRPEQKKQIEQALDNAIKDLKAVGNQIQQDWNRTWTGWTLNHTVVPVRDWVLFPVLHPIRTTSSVMKGIARATWGTVKFPVILKRKTGPLVWKVVKLPFIMANAALGRKK